MRDAVDATSPAENPKPLKAKLLVTAQTLYILSVALNVGCNMLVKPKDKSLSTYLNTYGTSGLTKILLSPDTSIHQDTIVRM